MLLLPSVGFLVLMTIFPTIYSLWMSTQQYNLSRPDLAHFVGLRNYGQLLTDDLFWKALRVTFVFSFSVLALQFVLGFFIANLFDRERRGMNLLRTLFIIPVFASPVALGLTWRYMYQPGYGLINYVLESVGLPRVNWLASTAMGVAGGDRCRRLAVDAVRRAHPAGRDAVDLAGDHRGGRTRRADPLPVPVADRAAAPDADHRRRRADPADRRAEDVRLIYVITRGGPGTTTYTLPLHAYAMGFDSFLMGPSAAIAWVVVIIVNICAVVFLWLLAREQA